MSCKDPVVLNYGNCLLRHSDLQLLSAPSWLNDNLIAFYFEYLETDIYPHHADLFAFVCPQVVQYLKFSAADDLRSTVEGLGLDKKSYSFFPVNDCRAQTTPGGTHWTLLVFNSLQHVFEHYDSSSGGYNQIAAENLASVLFPFLRSANSSRYVASVVEMPCTQQANSYDCGMHVICNTDGLCKKYLKRDERSLAELVPSSYVSRSRDTLRDVIYSLRK